MVVVCVCVCVCVWGGGGGGGGGGGMEPSNDYTKYTASTLRIINPPLTDLVIIRPTT